MIVECPHCKSLLRTDSRAVERAGTVSCGACFNPFDALEHIRLDAALEGDGAPDVSRARQPTGFERTLKDASPSGEAPVQQRHSTLARNQRPKRARRATIPLALGLLASVIAVVHVSRNQLASHPVGHAVASSWCAVVGCELTPAKDYSLIRLVRRQIQAHATRDDALVVSLAMVNDAHFAQDFPVLVVNMTDRAGKVIASGEFAPALYLDDFDDSVLMQPGRAVDVELAVEDPGTQAVSFDLAFR